MITLIQNLSLTNTAFNEFLNISNKTIGVLLKFYHGFTGICLISALIQLFEIRIQNNFVQMSRRFKLRYSYSYIVFTLQLHIVKNVAFKEEEIITF